MGMLLQRKVTCVYVNHESYVTMLISPVKNLLAQAERNIKVREFTHII